MSNFIEFLDAKLSEALQSWNMYTTLLTVAIASYLIYTIVTAQDPDAHPMILHRQSTASMIRQPGESAIYRSLDTPHGFPLRTGLNVKSPGAPAWASGKDGDLRDIWRRVTGELPPEPSAIGLGDQSSPETTQPKVITVMGRQEVIEHPISGITKEITVIGEHIKKIGGRRVALYLPNSIEFLTAVFASAFYGLDVILIPYNQPHEKVVELLQKTNADSLIAQAGALPFELISEACSTLKLIIWFVEHTSRHMDWTEVPEDVGGKIEVDAWHELVQNHQDTTNTNPPELKTEELGKVITVWQGKIGDLEIVESTQKNLVAAISALIAALPTRHRFNPSDLFLAADSFTHTYSLCLTLAALFSRASLAINSVAGPGVDLMLTPRNVAPTVMVASADSAANLRARTSAGATGPMRKFGHWLQSRALKAGRMPVDSFFGPQKTALGATPGKLRLLFVAEKAGIDTLALTSKDFCDLRIFTGSRVVYALTTARVAGAVAQTMIYDYRMDDDQRYHFGLPLGSLEIKLVDKGDVKTTEENPKGEIVVTGPAVAGGEARLGILGTIRDDNTLAYL